MFLNDEDSRGAAVSTLLDRLVWNKYRIAT